MEDIKREITPYDLYPIFELMDKAQKKLESLLIINKGLAKSDSISAEYLIGGLCDYYGINRDELITRRRNANLVRRRRMAAKLLSIHTDCTLAQIAIILGYRNHGSILYHLRVIDEQLSKNYYGYLETKTEYKQLLKHLKL